MQRAYSVRQPGLRLMPNAPKKPCRKIGCPTLTDTGYCEAHQSLKHEASRQFDANRGNSSERGYDAHWRKFREWLLRRRVMCEASTGCNRPGVELHHIVRIQYGGDKYDESNIQVLCKSHHSSLRGHGGRV
jgi:5-methylcytosine-specific restriction protein A